MQHVIQVYCAAPENNTKVVTHVAENLLIEMAQTFTWELLKIKNDEHTTHWRLWKSHKTSKRQRLINEQWQREHPDMCFSVCEGYKYF